MSTSVPSPVAVGDTLVVTASGQLSSFNRAAPSTVIGTVSITGLGTSETILGMDIRPADDKLYLLTRTSSNGGKVYTVDPTTGVATLVTTLTAAANDDNPFVALVGNKFAVNFNPAADRLRVISDFGQNLRVDVGTGAAITDGLINQVSASPTVTAAAYTDSFNGTATTALYDIDLSSGNLALQNPPNNGTLSTVGTLGLGSLTEARAMDIDARTNTAYAVLKAGSTGLYTINLLTGAATPVTSSAVTDSTVGLALVQPKAPTVFALTSANSLVPLTLGSATSAVTTGTPIAVTGLGASETLVGVDVRPANGLMYGLSNLSKVYTISSTGAATLVATLTTPLDPLATSFSVDFNPSVDRMRVISNTGQNLRVVVADVLTNNVVTTPAGSTTVDGTINHSDATNKPSPTVLAAAYSNNFAGTASTGLFDVEGTYGTLAQQGNPNVTPAVSPNTGTLFDKGPLFASGLPFTGGLDIVGGNNGLAIAALRTTSTGPFSLYSVNLSTGAATLYKAKSTDNALIGGTTGPSNIIDLVIKY